MAPRPPGGADVAAAIARYAPRSLSSEVAGFARAVVSAAQPTNPVRAKALLFCAGKLGSFATSVGLELHPTLVLSPSVIERFIVTQGAGHGPATRRTLRSNLRFLSAACLTNAPPAPVPLSRERSKAPYDSAEMAAYLALADAQPSAARRMRLSGLIALGAGAGLLGADLRAVCGTDVIVRSGGVLVEVKGRRVRVVPVLTRYHERLVASARCAGVGYVTGGLSATRRNVTSGLVASISGGADLPTLDVGRLRATWLHEVAGVIGLKAFMDAAGITCSQRLGDLVATLGAIDERRGVVLLGGGVKGGSTLAAFETIVDASGVAPPLEALLPLGVRPRQLSVRTLLLGILLALGDGRPAHLTRVHAALVALEDADRRRLGVFVEWKRGPHLLSYRQTERTVHLLEAALVKETPDGEPSEVLQRLADDLIEASIPTEYKEATTAMAVDWTDVESFARPPLKEGGETVDPEASWGHRRGNAPGQKDEVFYGAYLQLVTMVREENGGAVPELVRRLLLTSCHVDPPPALVAVIKEMAASGVALGDVLCDSGYAHRIPRNWSLPLRALGADLVMDLHPHDRGTQGTFFGAICFNGSLYCPATPKALFALEPLARSAGDAETAAHDRRSAELARYKMGPITADDADGFHRVACPAVLGKVRCPKRAASMALSHERPEILAAPEEPPTCCTQKTLTVPPSVNAKTRQKHDYPSRAHRLSYGRRSAAERSNATVKDPASNDIARGWCRLMGLTSLTLMLTCLFVVRNQRVLASFEARQIQDQRRAAQGLAPQTRRRRRQTISDLVSANAPP